LQLKRLKNELRKLSIAMLSTIKPDENDGAILGDNIWLQLGWRPPCEVSKNLVVSVAFSIGHGVIWSVQLFFSKPIV
jgi:hypothetical protein